MPSLRNEHNNERVNVLIVGGGIAGIVLAILLERKNFTVTLIEQSKEWKPVGGGVTITLNGYKLLQSLGLLTEKETTVNEIRDIHITDQNGKMLSSFNLDEYATTYAKTITMHRHELHKILLAQLQYTEVLCGTTFNEIKNEGNKVKVMLSNGLATYYDLVVGCDGINSSVRANVFSNVNITYSGYASWRFVAHDVTVDKGALTEMWGNGKRFGIVPLSGNRVHCFAAINTIKHSEAYHNISVSSFQNLFKEFNGSATTLINTVKNNDELMYHDLEEVHVRNWVNGRVVLIGDAAHGMTPNLTQGLSMAIEDAYVLANILGDNADIEKALAAFYDARKKRVLAVQKKSKWLGKIGQMNSPVMCGVRNFCWKHIPDKWIQNDLKNLLVNDVPRF